MWDDFKEEVYYYFKFPEEAIDAVVFNPFFLCISKCCTWILVIYLGSMISINIQTQWMISDQRSQRIEFLLDRQAYFQNNGR